MVDPEIRSLSPPWQQAFDEAWLSFQAGNFGIGAVLVDPDDGTIVSTGRNRVTETDPAPRTIGGNFLAHAEMNAFAAMSRFSARGLHLFTTLEPCLMCAATAIQLNVGHVHFAAVDEFFVGLDDLWDHHPYTRARRPACNGPLAVPLARFARVLPLSFTFREMPGSRAAERARRDEPELADVATRLGSPEFDAVRAAGTVDEAFELLAPALAGW